MNSDYKREKNKDWFLYFVLLLVFLMAAATLNTYAGTLDEWSWKYPWPPGNTLNEVAYGNGTYVAVGDSGVFLTSANGTDWTRHFPGVTGHMKGVTYDLQLFVAVGENGAILTSPNGGDWTVRESGVSEDLNNVTYGGGQFVAVGDNGTVTTSPDGKTWTKRFTDVNINIEGIAYGNSLYVAVCEGGILTSPNGIGWTQSDPDLFNTYNSEYKEVTFGNGVFVTSSRFSALYSTDGLNWTVLDSSIRIASPKYINGQFVGVGAYASVYTSPDGINWTLRSTGPFRTLYGVTWGNAGYVAVGQYGAVFTSTDCINWTPLNATETFVLGSIAYGNSTYVAVGCCGEIYSSTDGNNWKVVDPGTDTSLTGVAFGNSLFVAVGRSGVILSSPDGVNWTRQNSNHTHVMTDIVYGNSRFVAVGLAGVKCTSTDGINWTTVVTGYGGTFDAIHYGNSMFVAANTFTSFYYSRDGLTWEEGNLDSNRMIIVNDIAYGNGMFLAMGNYGYHYSSVDGINWTAIEGQAIDVRGLAFGNGTFLVVGDYGKALSSLDGIKWRSHDTGTINDLYDVMYKDYSFWIVGRGNSILQSGTFMSISGNAGAPGVELSNGDGWSPPVIADEDGDYCMYVSRGWYGTVTPGLTGYRFTPDSRYYTPVYSNKSNQDYTAEGDTVTISGTVTDGTNPLENATVTFSHNNHKEITDSSGNFSYTVPYGVTTTVTASLPNYTFSPSNYDFTGLTQNMPDRDFTGTYTPSGTVAITNPRDGDTVSGAVIVTAEPLDAGVTLVEVDFYIDGEKVKDDTASPFQYRWETATVQNGTHAIAIEAVDGLGQIYQDQIIVAVNNPTGAPQIETGRNRLNFGMIAGGTPTGPQSVLIGNSGGGILTWQAVASDSWIQVTPANGSGDGMITVSVNGAGLNTGSYMGTVSISDAGAVNSPVNIDVYLEVMSRGQENPPFGTFETPGDGVTVRGSIPVTGWVLDDIEVTSVTIYRDPVGGESPGLKYIGDAILVDGARPDVEAHYPGYPKSYKAGWGYMMLTYGLPNQGNGTFTITAKAVDSTGNEITLGSKTITGDNDNATKPFGALDSPAPGAEISGTAYKNWAWALTPQPNTIPTDGSTISVWIDGKKLPGNPVYNINRPDIASLFPGYNNSNGAGGYYLLDTTLYENGIHTISWSVKDDAGNSDGIGSRFFSIYNQAGANRSKRAAKIGGDSKIDGFGVSLEPVHVVTGYKETGTPGMISPGENGLYVVDIKQNERVEIRLNSNKPGSGIKKGVKYRVFSTPGGNLNIPAGSAFDPVNGIFYWVPGPGFLGTYDFKFAEYFSNGAGLVKTVRIVIHPKY